jgi:hypothetical protein
MKKDNDFLKSLDTVNKVDPPDFLFTRIAARIERVNAERIAPKKAMAIAITFVVLLVINIYAIRQVSHRSNERNLAQVFQLMPDKNLYE